MLISKSLYILETIPFSCPRKSDLFGLEQRQKTCLLAAGFDLAGARELYPLIARGTGKVQMLPSIAPRPRLGSGCKWRRHEQPLSRSRVECSIQGRNWSARVRHWAQATCASASANAEPIQADTMRRCVVAACALVLRMKCPPKAACITSMRIRCGAEPATPMSIGR